MIARMSTCQSLILLTNKPSSLLVLTLSAISFFHMERLLVSRLSWHLDPGGSRHAGWKLSTGTLAMMKYLCTEGRDSLDWWWSQFRSKEQWPLHDVDLGTVAVCSSISAIRLSGHLDLEDSRDTGWVQNSNYFAGTMRIHSMKH
jgi:hypothetical protein